MPDGDENQNELLRHACAEARHTVDQRIEKIHQEDRKAVRVFRANLLLLGFIISIISLSVGNTKMDPYQFINAHTTFGALLLIVSILFSAMAYTSSNFKLGVNTKPLQEIENDDMDEREYLEILSQTYQDSIEFNRKVNQFNTHAIVYALDASTLGLIFFTGGILIGSVHMRGHELSYALLALEILFIPVVMYLFGNSDTIFKNLFDIEENGDITGDDQ